MLHKKCLNIFFICTNFKEEDDKKLWTRTTKGTWTTVPRFLDMDIACMFMACNPTPLGITPPKPSTPPSFSSAAEHGNSNKRGENYGQGKSSFAKKRRAGQSNQQRQHSGHQAGGKTCPINSGTSSFMSKADVKRQIKENEKEENEALLVTLNEETNRAFQAEQQGVKPRSSFELFCADRKEKYLKYDDANLDDADNK